MRRLIAEQRGISSAGRAPALQAGGRRFDPVILHHWELVEGSWKWLVSGFNNKKTWNRFFCY